VFFLAVSFCCGSFIFIITKNPVFLILMLTAGILAVEYTAPPLRLAYRRSGEADIFILFGVLMVMGSFYLFAETFTFGSFLISLPVAFLIAGVLICNEVPDFPGDAAAGKMNLISLTGRERGYLLYAGVLVLSMLCVIINVFSGHLPPIALGLLLFYFFGFKATVILKDHFKDIESSIIASRMTIILHGAVGSLMVVVLFFRR
jgi:1,4-dihydroxy-2-naphthoate octaprenyltransferase